MSIEMWDLSTSPTTMEQGQSQMEEEAAENTGGAAEEKPWKEVPLNALDGFAEELASEEKPSNIFSMLSRDARGPKRAMLGGGEDFIKFTNDEDEKENDEATTTLEDGEQEDTPTNGAFPPWVQSPETLYALKHSMNTMVTLHYEILDFCRFVTPTKAEHQQRMRLVERIEKTVASLWPNARTLVFGSFATGLYLPASDIDMCIVDTPRKGSLEEMEELAEAIRKVPGLLRKIQVIHKARVPLVKLIDKDSNVAIDISFNRLNGPQNVAVIRQYIDDFPALKPLLMVIKCFLQQRNLGEMHQYNFPRPANSLGEMLLDFFELYGERFNHCYAGLAVRDGGNYYRKMEKYGIDAYQPMLFSLEDPQEDYAEIARNSFASMTIRRAFGTARQMCSRWRPDTATTDTPTPLSAILYIDQLIWTRRNFANEARHDSDDGGARLTETDGRNGAILSRADDSPGRSQAEPSQENEEHGDRYEPQPIYAYKPEPFPTYSQPPKTYEPPQTYEPPRVAQIPRAPPMVSPESLIPPGVNFQPNGFSRPPDAYMPQPPLVPNVPMPPLPFPGPPPQDVPHAPPFPGPPPVGMYIPPPPMPPPFPPPPMDNGVGHLVSPPALPQSNLVDAVNMLQQLIYNQDPANPQLGMFPPQQ